MTLDDTPATSAAQGFSFASIIHHTNDVVVVTDAAARNIVYVNPAFTTLTRYTFDEVLGRSPGKLLQGPQTNPDTVLLVRAALWRQQPLRTEILNYDKFGRAYWLDINIVPLRDARGELHHFAAIERDITHWRRDHEKLRQLAGTDVLTGLANRRAFDEALRREILQARRVPAPLAMIAFDIDKFKRVNDQHGHEAGDEVLRAVAERCAAILRPRDVLARTGGEEFIALLPDTELAPAVLVAERLRRAVCDEPVWAARQALSISASFGVTTVPADDMNGSLSLRQADRLMYGAKVQGRNCVNANSGLTEPARL